MKAHLKRLILVLAIPAACGLAAESAKYLMLAAGGRSEYTIVVAPQAQLPERFAAQELQKYIHQISGVILPIADHAVGRKSILVGGAAGELESIRNRGSDAYLIRIDSAQISLAGASPRATLFSVYHFLEKYLGCGWVVPGDDFVPSRTELELPDQAEEVES